MVTFTGVNARTREEDARSTHPPVIDDYESDFLTVSEETKEILAKGRKRVPESPNEGR